MPDEVVVRGVARPVGIQPGTPEWQAWVDEIEKVLGRHICGARSKSTGGPCPNYCISNRTRCHYHGGRTPIGAAATHYKTGRYSKALPEHLAATYQEALSDDDLISLRDEIALLDTRTHQLLGKLSTADVSRELVLAQANLEKCFVVYQETEDSHPDVHRKAIESLEKAIKRTGDVLRHSVKEAEIWKELQRHLNLRRRVAEAERRRLTDLQQFVTAEKAMALVASLVTIIQRHVTDTKALGAISADVALLLTSGGESPSSGLGRQVGVGGGV